MLAKILSSAIIGLEAVPVEVEVDVVKKGLPSFTIVGLPDKAVEEAKDRVRSAIVNSNAIFPDHRITVNLAPADLPKIGPSYDLPIAVGILIASGQIPRTQELENSLVLGELSLDGSLRRINGALPVALLAKRKKIGQIFLPESNAKEAAVVEGVKIFPTQSLTSLVYHLNGISSLSPTPPAGLKNLSRSHINAPPPVSISPATINFL